MSIKRITVTLSDDVAVGVERLRRERGFGLSQAVNALVRAGLAVQRSSRTFQQQTHDLGSGVDLSNVGETLEALEGPAR